jgi:uncharacterized protein (TIGR02145 family)
MHHKNVKLFALTLFCIGLTGIQAQTLKDIDGNVYRTVTIGEQLWMAENLKTTKYCNGDSIRTTSPATLDITSESTPKYQWAYDGNEINIAIYGRLYTWYAVIDSRNICPSGWHVPTDAEWTILTDYLTNNGYGYKGNRDEISKSMAATSGWTTNYIDGNVGNDQMSNDKSGFSAFGGGYRYGNGAFNGFGSFGYWWSATEVYATTALYRNLSYYHNDVYRDSSSKQNGISIRCIKNKKSRIPR